MGIGMTTYTYKVVDQHDDSLSSVEDIFDGTKVIGQIKTEVNITVQDVDDIVDCAFAGGINYWCSRAFPRCNVWPSDVEYASQCLTRGYDLTLVDSEEVDDDGNPTEYHLNLASFLRGFEVYCDRHGKNVSYLLEDYDASDADCIIQYALFGNLVYG